MDVSDISLRKLEEIDVGEVTKLIYSSFFRDEPLNVSLNVGKSSDAVESPSYVPKLVTRCARDAISAVALNQRGEIIGCRLSLVETPTRQWSWQNESGTDAPNNSKISKLLSDLESGVDVFTLYSVDKCVTFEMLTVRDDFRKKGLAKRLVDYSLSLAVGKGLTVVKVIASNKITEKLYTNQGYDRLKVIRCDEYLNERGELAFPNMIDTVQVVLFAKRLAWQKLRVGNETKQ